MPSRRVRQVGQRRLDVKLEGARLGCDGLDDPDVRVLVREAAAARRGRERSIERPRESVVLDLVVLRRRRARCPKERTKVAPALDVGRRRHVFGVALRVARVGQIEVPDARASRRELCLKSVAADRADLPLGGRRGDRLVGLGVDHVGGEIGRVDVRLRGELLPAVARLLPVKEVVAGDGDAGDQDPTHNRAAIH